MLLSSFFHIFSPPVEVGGSRGSSEAKLGGNFSNPGTIGEGILERFGIDVVVLEYMPTVFPV